VLGLARHTWESSHDDRSNIGMLDPGFHVNGTRGVNDDNDIVGCAEGRVVITVSQCSRQGSYAR
jgi:hypothetical protein